QGPHRHRRHGRGRRGTALPAPADDAARASDRNGAPCTTAGREGGGGAGVRTGGRAPPRDWQGCSRRRPRLPPGAGGGRPRPARERWQAGQGPARFRRLSVAKVAFLAHCLLNQNAKCLGGAKRPAMWEPVVDLLQERGWTIRQMACPELAFGGARRFWWV